MDAGEDAEGDEEVEGVGRMEFMAFPVFASVYWVGIHKNRRSGSVIKIWWVWGYGGEGNAG